MALFSTKKWMHTWALLDIMPLLTLRAQNLGHLFTFQPLLWKAAKAEDCFASQSHPDYSSTQKNSGDTHSCLQLKSSKNIRDVLFLSPPTIMRESLQFTSFVPYFHSEWLICEYNFSPNQIMQKRDAVLPVLLLDRNWKRTEGLACGHRIIGCCGFHHSWLVILNIFFKMSHPTPQKLKFINNSILQKWNVNFQKFRCLEAFVIHWVLGSFLFNPL